MGHGNTALVLVQPHTILGKKKKELDAKKLAECKRHLDWFVEEAKKRGAKIVYVGYTNPIWMRLVELSDLVFLFEVKERKKMKADETQRELSKGEQHYLGKRELNETLWSIPPRTFEEPSNTDSYYAIPTESWLEAAGILRVYLIKNNTRKILVCGGTDANCVRMFIYAMNSKYQTLEILVSTKLLARDTGVDSLESSLKEGSVRFKTCDAIPKKLLDIF